MVGGTIRRKVIHRESFRASVLHLSENQAVLQSIAAKKSDLTTPSLLSMPPAVSNLLAGFVSPVWSRNERHPLSHHGWRFSNGADRDGVPRPVPEVVDLLFLGHRDTTITIALLTAFFSVTKNTARPKLGGTEPTHNTDQA